MRYLLLLVLMASIISEVQGQQRKRARDYGLKIGVLPTGKFNAITDVPGVKVGHSTLIEGNNIRTGVTAILPHEGNIFQDKVPAAVYVGNGFGKLAGSTQVQELGNLETPIILTNTLSVGTAMNAVVNYTLTQTGNEEVRSVNAVVGETNDGYLNDIRGRHVTENQVLESIKQAKTGQVVEGNVGAGTGTVCFGFKGGIGTASRKLPESVGGYTVGVLVQTNFGGVLQIDGVGTSGSLQESIPLGSHLASHYGVGLDSLMEFYPLEQNENEQSITRALKDQLGIGFTPYCVNGSKELIDKIAFDMIPGNTLTCPGFYAPQGRVLRGGLRNKNLLQVYQDFTVCDFKLTNFEMETAGYYAMGRLLGHEMLSLNAIVANRITQEFAPNAEEVIDSLIQKTLDRI